jgi:hypothetical protein
MRKLVKIRYAGSKQKLKKWLRIRAFVMFIITSGRYTLHLLLLGNLANGTYL